MRHKPFQVVSQKGDSMFYLLPHVRSKLAIRRRHQAYFIAAAAILMLLVLALSPTTRTAHASSSLGPDVFRPGSSPYGVSYGAWSARWWQWALSIPKATNPILDTTGANCAQAQSGPAWFLAGTF